MEIIYPENFFKVFEEPTNKDEVGEFEIISPFDLSFDSSNDSRNENRIPQPNNMPPNGQFPPNIGNAPSNLGVPPSHIPAKNNANVKTVEFNNSPQGKYDGPNQQKHGGPNHGYYPPGFNPINMCLRKYTYIWQRNGRSYWSYLMYADRYQVSGWRWINWRWVYFALDVRNIESFYC